MCHGNKNLSSICTTDLGVWKYKYYKTIALLYIAFDFVIMSGEDLQFWGRNLKTLQSSEHVQFIIDKADRIVHGEKVEHSFIDIMMHTRFAGSQWMSEYWHFSKGSWLNNKTMLKCFDIWVFFIFQQKYIKAISSLCMMMLMPYLLLG